MRNAKIVCTLGPASFDRETIRGLADAGMSVARMNASHGNVEHRSDVIDSIRAVDDATDEPLAAMLDLQGPEVRTADIDEDIYLETGSEVRFYEGDDATPEAVGLSYSITAAESGDTILLDDGRIEATVERVEDDSVHATIVSGGKLSSRKGVNVPGVDLDIDLITDSDYENLKLAAKKEVDYVAASFIRDAEDVYTISDTLENLGAEIPIIAKIERAGAVENLDEIIQAAHGVMVARGDLGVECPLEEVPIIQKRTIRKAQAAGAPVITATEMLDSMVRSRRPTRAEASDVANAVLDGTDAVMLSGETAVGDHPVRVVETMSRIVEEVEESPEYDESQEQRVPTADEGSRTEALARSARYLARDVNAAAVVAVSESGYTARKTAKFRPGVPVVAVTPNDRTRRQLAVSWGVSAQYADYSPSVEGVMDDAVTAALDAGVAESGDTIVVLSGMMTELEGTNTTNMLKVHVAAEPVATGRKIVSGRVAGPLYRTEDGDLTDVPEGAILALSAEFDGEFNGDADKLAGIVDARAGMTGYPALVARELDIPMVSGAPLPKTIKQGATVTLHAERGIVYEGDVISHDRGNRK
ncbi:pyruvate kinase [Haloferax prahovense DSM 18310]|uniref:Pyruvate kinase n=1 Tax=Haloferax prahovense (strain DSM 18310 / JCM 13924 / TL6) TaxID=1227461 RepID=M0GLR8_HALPT|nr:MULTISPECIES: pyruvate kinase [Haloferax]ELZ73140.1 pyruvate kinase [Haloferax prahovense DSM 18310]RDZ43539.1 pyruvate kinase [Haloferax sp. Atlit-19N]